MILKLFFFVFAKSAYALLDLCQHIIHEYIQIKVVTKNI